MEKIIKECTIESGRFTNTILVGYGDGEVNDRIASYYPDELYFDEGMFIGLTRNQAVRLVEARDMAYLRS